MLRSFFSRSLAALCMKIFIDGKFCSERDAKVSVFDHGLLYGDGVFEGIRAYNGRVFKLKEHIDRLFYSAKAILLEIPMSHRRNDEGHGGDHPRQQVARCLRPAHRHARHRHARLESAQLQKAVRHHHRRQNPGLSAGTLRARHGHRDRADGAQSAQRGQPGHQVAELFEQHPRQDRGEQRRRGRGRDVERRRFRGRMHGGQFVHRQKRRAVHAAAVGGRALRHHARAR